MAWLDGKHGPSPVSLERYRAIVGKGIAPTLGESDLQKLKPVHGQRVALPHDAEGLAHWRGIVGSHRAAPLPRLARCSTRCGEARSSQPQCCRRCGGTQARSERDRILDADQIAAVLYALKGHRLHPIVSLALATGLRRGELLALRWSDLDLGSSFLKVERSLEEIKGRSGSSAPKTKSGRRSFELPPSAVAMLADHRRAQLELRLQLGMGKHEPDALVFCNHDGTPISPNSVSKIWRRSIPR